MQHDVDTIQEQSVEEMNLVKILSHEQELVNGVKEEKKSQKSPQEKVPVEAHALTIKEDCIESLLDICSEVRP